MSIVLDRLVKRYGRLVVVDRVSLEVNDGEMFVLLGQSGSGKSTILRLIAGLAPADEGRIVLHGKDVTALPPQQRGTGFVFQNYSIFRHMSVAENVEFGLKIRKVPAAARAQKRDELLDMVGLMGLGTRYADQLSGGQLQRVALARALAYEPSVLLLDEPFGALDVRIRAQLRRSLKEIQRRLKVATILVTHDQEEAFELADRIGVLERGRLLEVGESESLYAKPASLSVASFLGGGTVLAARAQGGRVTYGDLSLPVPPEVSHQEGDWVTLLVRPEQVALTPTSGDTPSQDGVHRLGTGEVAEHSFAGTHRRVRVRLPRLSGTRQISPPLPFGEEGTLVEAILPSESALPTGALSVDLRGWHVLAAPPSRVLVYEPAESASTALPTAAAIAESIDGSLTLLGVAQNAEGVEPLRASMNTRRDALQVPRAEVKVRSGDATRQVALEQQEAFYELLVVPATSAQIGRLVTRLLERPYTPILVVPPTSAEAKDGADSAAPDIRRILICTRAGEPGKSDVRVGGWLARRLGASVTLLYISPPGIDPAPRVHEHLERGAATLRAMDIPTELRVRQAPSAVEGIVRETVDGQHDLTVLGSHGPRARGGSLRDDVTYQVLTRTATPILVVPAEE